MSLPQTSAQSPETPVVRVHYWAAAKSAAGVAGDDLSVDGPISLSEVQRRAVALHPDTRLGDVLKSCSALLGDNLDLERIEANYDSGVLRLTVPVAERAKPRKIEVALGGSDNERTAIEA